MHVMKQVGKIGLHQNRLYLFILFSANLFKCPLGDESSFYLLEWPEDVMT